MPTLHWTGKEKVINIIRKCRSGFRSMCYAYRNGEQIEEKSRSVNKIIHGDNLDEKM